MNRLQGATLTFALVAVALTVITTVVAFQGVRLSFEREYGRRLTQIAEIAASQVSADDLDDVRRQGVEGTGYLALQAQLDVLRATAGLDNLAVVDSAGGSLYDVRRGEDALGEPSAYDSTAHDALVRARSGRTVFTAVHPRGRDARVAIAPVHRGLRTEAVLVAEGTPSWAPELAGLRRSLSLVAAVSVLAVLALAALLMRVAGQQLALERRLSRSENLAAMGRMTATLAHEIKNPLAIIRGSAKRLGREGDESAALAESVIEEVDRLSRTVNRYLQFARAEPLASATGDAAAALAATLDLIEGESRARHCRLERSGDFAPAVVRLDAESLKQVFLNLVLNALEAVPEGGTVRASVERAGARVRLSIADDGPGIAPEVLQRLGEPFFTTRSQGTGLGLFLSRRLVQAAGGELRIESVPGRGTTCVVDLPVATT